ncbi:MAG: RuvX/YqgF family protein [Patescibacteria group bacterium]
MRIVAVDLGKARSGLAVSDEAGITARPLTTVPTDRLAEELGKLVKGGISTVVVGRPRTLSGGLGPQAKWVEDQVSRLKLALPATFVYEDETASTTEAEAGGDGSDAAAARVILQGYLNERA